MHLLCWIRLNGFGYVVLIVVLLLRFMFGFWLRFVSCLLCFGWFDCVDLFAGFVGLYCLLLTDYLLVVLRLGTFCDFCVGFVLLFWVWYSVGLLRDL